VAHGHTDLADLASGQLVVGVVARLRRQVERHRQTRLALGQVAPVELVGPLGGGVARVGPDHPGTVALTVGRVRHRTPPRRGSGRRTDSAYWRVAFRAAWTERHHTR
jgi:hypothetical protein